MRQLVLIALVSFSAVAQTPMRMLAKKVSAGGGWTTVATDNFDRAAPLGANWTQMSIFGSMTITSNEASGAAATGEHGALWNANAFNNIQASEATISGLTAGEYIGVIVRAGDAGATHDCYGFEASTTDSYLFEVANAVWTQIGSTGPGLSDGDVIRLEANGTALTVYRNGSTSGMPSGTDATLASGSCGIWAYNGTGPRLNNWKGEHQ